MYIATACRSKIKCLAKHFKTLATAEAHYFSIFHSTLDSGGSKGGRGRAMPSHELPGVM